MLEPEEQIAAVQRLPGLNWNNLRGAEARRVSDNYLVKVWAQLAVENITDLEPVLRALGLPL